MNEKLNFLERRYRSRFQQIEDQDCSLQDKVRVLGLREQKQGEIVIDPKLNYISAELLMVKRVEREVGECP